MRRRGGYLDTKYERSIRLIVSGMLPASTSRHTDGQNIKLSCPRDLTQRPTS